MNLTQLRYFLSVVESGSMTQAANANFVSQSAVSKTIKQLEDELDIKLFDRKGRGLNLNRQGKLFYSYVSDGIRLLDRGVQAIKSDINANEEPISILFQVSSPLIPIIIEQVKKNLPNIRLNLSQHIQGSTDLDQFDFIISDHTYTNRINTPLFSEEIMLGGHNLPPTVDYQDLQNQNLITLNSSLELRRTIDSFFSKENIHLNYRYETDDPATLRELVNQGIGNCFVPLISWQNFAKKIQLAHILPTPPMRTLYLSQKEKKSNNIFREFTNELLRIFEKNNSNH